MNIDARGWADWPGLAPLLAALGGGEVTRIVGGAVRDRLFELPVSDVDLATRLLPEETRARLEAAGIKAVPTGIAHGTVTAVVGGRPFEVTTLRRDVETDGRRARVAFTNDWREDAARRDFTINAMSADPDSGALFDYFGGREDIAARRVRFIGDPLERIAEDHLRILRFFRFHARFGAAEPDRASLDACSARANDLMALSRERIADELLKLLSLSDPEPTVALMHDRGIFAPVLPEIGSEGLARLGLLIGREAAAGIAADPLRRLGTLLPSDPGAARDAAARLKLSNRARVRIACAAGREAGDARASAEALAYRHGLDCALDRMLTGEATPARERLVALENWQRPRLPIGGGALIARGMEPGPQVALTLRRIEEEWIDAGFPKGAAFDALLAAQIDPFAARDSQ